MILSIFVLRAGVLPELVQLSATFDLLSQNLHFCRICAKLGDLLWSLRRTLHFPNQPT